MNLKTEMNITIFLGGMVIGALSGITAATGIVLGGVEEKVQELQSINLHQKELIDHCKEILKDETPDEEEPERAVT